MSLSTASLFLLGCDNTKLVSSWADPHAANYSFKKPIAVAVLDYADLRSFAEEAIVRNIMRVQACPSHIVLREGESKDLERTKQRLLADGYDGAIVLRLVDVEDKVNYVSATYPSYYYHYWNYYSWAWNSAIYSPAYIQKERIVRLETSLFSIKDDKHLWVGVSKSNNPESVSSLIDEIAEVIGKELRKQGIVQ